MATIHSLPAELHGHIVPYLTDADLREYRLVCKDMAAYGAREYFRVLKFHASSASVRRLQNIASEEGLRKCVHTLVWDSNLWDINIPDDEEWMQNPEGDLRRQILEENYRKLYPDSWWLPKEIQQKVNDLHAHMLLYKERRHDERVTLRKALHHDHISDLLRQFSSVRSIRIMNGAFQIQDRALQKTRTSIQRDTLDFIPRGDSLFDPDLEEGPPGVHALTRAVEGISKLTRPWKLEVNALGHTFFTPTLYPEGFEAKLNKLTSLRLTLICVRPGQLTPDDGFEERRDCKAVLKCGLLKQLLRGMKTLRSLSLSFPARFQTSRFDAVASIRDVIPLEEGWTDLHELSLSTVDTTEEDFIKLLGNHSTLKKLHLQEMCLVPQGSWIRVFEAVQPILKLTSCTFGPRYLYGFCQENGMNALIWWLDGELGPALSKYLVSGGECPLREDNTVWHGVTADGRTWLWPDYP